MQKSIFNILLILSFSSLSAQNINQLDSLVYTNIESLKKYVVSDTLKMSTNGENRYFLETLIFAECFKFEFQGYSHAPMINKKELNAIQQWYKYNRKRINSEKVLGIYNVLVEYNNAYLIVNKRGFEAYDQVLDSLDTELNNVIKINTFIDNRQQKHDEYVTGKIGFASYDHKPADYTIIKLDSIKNWYIIYAEKNDSVFKIVSLKYNRCECTKILVGNQYNLLLHKTIMNVLSENGMKLLPMNYLHIQGATFNPKTDVWMTYEEDVVGLYICDNLKGLCLK